MYYSTLGLRATKRTEVRGAEQPHSAAPLYSKATRNWKPQNFGVAIGSLKMSATLEASKRPCDIGTPLQQGHTTLEASKCRCGHWKPQNVGDTGSLGWGIRVACFVFCLSRFSLRVSGFGSRVSAFGFQLSGCGVRVQNAGLRGRSDLMPHER